MVTIPDLKIQPAKLKLVMDQWKQYGIMMVMAITIMVMDITESKSSYFMGCWSCWFCWHYWYVMFVLLYPCTKNIKTMTQKTIRETAAAQKLYEVF